MAKSTSSIIPIERIYKSILVIRGHKIILDRDLAQLYGVETKVLNRVDKEEFENLRFHFGTSSWGGPRYRPRAFTEQGVAMLSSVLRSKRAVEVNIAIMRTFVKLRQILATNSALRRKIEAMERRYDEQFKLVFKVLSEMVMPTSKSKSKIGFLTEAQAHKKGTAKEKCKK